MQAIQLSFEVSPPPAQPAGESAFFKGAQRLLRFNPLFFSLTCHSPNTPFQQKALQNRLNTTTKTPIVPHLTWGNLPKSTLENLLERYQEQKIKTLLLLKGDTSKIDSTTSQILRNIRKSPAGKNLTLYTCLDPNKIGQKQRLLEEAKEKIDAGTDGFICQACFDPSSYLELKTLFDSAKVMTPLIPSLLPVFSCSEAHRFSKRLNIPLGRQLMRLMSQTENPTEAAFLMFNRNLIKALASEEKRLHIFTLNAFEKIDRLLS